MCPFPKDLRKLISKTKRKMSDELKYDEDTAVDFIRKTLPADVSGRCSDDDIVYIIDIIWEWYEKNGYLSLDADLSEEEEEDIAGITDYVKKQIARDKNINMDTSDVELIVKGELQYEESIDDFI